MINLYDVKLHQQILEEQCGKTISLAGPSRSRKLMGQMRQLIGRRLVKIGDSMQKNVW